MNKNVNCINKKQCFKYYQVVSIKKDEKIYDSNWAIMKYKGKRFPTNVIIIIIMLSHEMTIFKIH